MPNEADFVIDIHAGAEKAVAATKTYTAELLAMAMLSTALDKDKKREEELENIPEWAEKILSRD